ncbi:MAG: amino acid adenylation domain-containing protein, partial [Desulfobacterales bacterium]|nr:amino acid adenylation domain-containing protein [Desulfobacterales bacterium]
GAASPLDLMQRLATRQAEQEAWSHCHLAEIQTWSEVPPGLPLFESLLVFENYPADNAPGESSIRLRIDDEARHEVDRLETMAHPLTIVIAPGPELKLRFIYDANRFNDDAAARAAGHFRALCERILANPRGRISDLSPLTREERRQILVEWSGAKAPLSPHPAIQCMFEARAAETPEAVAVVFGEERVTYRELNRRANRLAHYLRGLGVGPDAPVGLRLSRGVEMITAILGILKAGGAYLPLDPAYPPDRVAFMLSDAGARFAATREKEARGIPARGVRLVLLDREREEIARQEERNPTRVNTPDHLAYILYTSGSTGAPKGVAMEHRGPLALLEWTLQYFTREQLAGVLAPTSICFDFSVFHMFAPLAAGGKMILLENFLHLPEAPGADEITLIDIMPSVLAEHLNVHDLPPRVNTVCLGGEPLTARLAARVYEHDSVKTIIHCYGPTEDAVNSTVHRTPRGARGPFPIGRPLPNTRAYILNPHLQPVPAGAPGELHLAGEGLMRGYINRPGLTKRTLIPDPFSAAPGARMYRTGDLARWRPDGSIEWIGRMDHQIKIRGFRVEPGEVEAAISRHPRVRQVVVTDREDASRGGRVLIAHVVPDRAMDNPPGELRRFLKERLPDYMIPSGFVILDAMPLNANGKIDRGALRSPAPPEKTPRKETAAPRTPLEKELAAIWAEVLEVETVGVHDDFFELGGHSLLLVRLLARIRKRIHRSVSMSVLFQEPTAAGLARRLSSASPPAAAPPAWVDLEKEGVLPPEIRALSPAPRIRPAPRCIFLTGASGFVGAFLLEACLRKTSAHVHCLVRAPDPAAGRKRIMENLEKRRLTENVDPSRIHPTPGDLARPLLGLDEKRFHRLAEQVDLIIHNGALVNFTSPYEAVRRANVDGTREVLKLASLARAAPVHYISTTGVLSRGRFCHEGSRIEEQKHATAHGYTASKWVAEKLVMTARRRGMPCAIHRLGRITGSSRTGACQSDDFFHRMIRGCTALGAAPEETLASRTDLTPVDFTAEAVVSLALSPESDGQNYHLIHPDRIGMSRVFEVFNRVLNRAGAAIPAIPYNQWLKRVEAFDEKTPDSPFHLILPLLREKSAAIGKSRKSEDEEYHLDCKATVEVLSRFNMRYPPPEDLLDVYFNYLKSEELL